MALIGLVESDGETLPSIALQHAKHLSGKMYLESNRASQHFLKIVTGLFAAVHYLHTRSPPVVHGNLNDDNISVTESGGVLLRGFGLSRFKHPQFPSSDRHRSSRFIAPEIYNAEDVSADMPSDIYSLAMTIYALGTLSQPSAGLPSDFDVARAVQRRRRPSKPDSLGGLRADDTKLLWPLLEKMWHHDPKQRPTISVARSALMQNGLARY